MTKREFSTGANRNSDEGKLDFEGFFSPFVLERIAEYMQKHRATEDGTLRDSDNWQKGMPRDAYIKSAWRHFHAWWTCHRGHVEYGNIIREDNSHAVDAICALIFNAMGYLHEVLRNRDVGADDGGS